MAEQPAMPDIRREHKGARSSPEAQKAVVDKETSCLAREGPEIDDGISPANVIGHHVGEASRSEIINARLVLFQRLTFMMPPTFGRIRTKL